MGNEEIRNKAYDDYCAGMKYRDIAEKYSVSLSAVKSWVARYWKKGCNQKEESCNLETQKLQSQKRKAAKGETKHRFENPHLTDRQALFCMYYVNCLNATQAYKKVYGCSYNTAKTEGYRTLTKPYIKREIERLKKEKYEAAMFDERDIFQWHLDVATASITDYISFGREEVPLNSMFGPVIDEKTGEPYTKEVNYVKFKESDEVDGRVIKKVKMGKDGASIELYDAFKSMEWLENNLQMGTDSQRSIANQILVAYRERKRENDGE